jgi:hypothetical protein
MKFTLFAFVAAIGAASALPAVASTVSTHMRSLWKFLPNMSNRTRAASAPQALSPAK